MRTSLLLATLLFAAVPAFAQEAQPAAPAVCPTDCPDGGCVAQPCPVRGCNAVPAECPGLNCRAVPVDCPDGACVARPMPPRHHPEPRHWRGRPRPVKDGQAMPQPLTPAQRAARLRARAAQLEQMAADIEAGKEPPPPKRVRRPRPGGQRPEAAPAAPDEASIPATPEPTTEPAPAAPDEASIPATPEPTPEPAPAPAPDVSPAPEA